jgi:enterochelin esterase-like enzyme
MGWAMALVTLVVAGWTTGRAQPANEAVHYRRLEVEAPWGTQRVLVTFPRRPDRLQHPPGERYPVVIALHGRGEADPERGHIGWASRYGLSDAFGALSRNRVSTLDYRSFVRDAHLAYVNESLRVRPFGGVMVVTPYVPDISDEPIGSDRMRQLGDWLAGPLLSAVREGLPGAALTREGTGIDGVSMGGRVALEVGFAHPEAFGAVGGIQPAIRGDEDALTTAAASATARHGQRIRLLSSENDPFLVPTRRLSSGLAERRIAHTLTVVPGPHDYAFNRGPGSLELLLFHDRALAREPLAD